MNVTKEQCEEMGAYVRGLLDLPDRKQDDILGLALLRAAHRIAGTEWLRKPVGEVE